MRDNPHAARARIAKAWDLAEAFSAELVKVSPDLNPTSIPGSIVVRQHAQSAKPELWADVASLHGINPPSEETIALAIKFLEQRATTVEKYSADPFANLT